MQILPVSGSSNTVQFEFRKQTATFNLNGTPPPGNPFSLELSINPLLQRRKFYFGIHDWGTAARQNGGTMLTHDRMAVITSTFEWFYGAQSVGVEPFYWLSPFGAVAAATTNSYSDLPLQSDWKDTGVNGNVNSLAADAWIINVNSQQLPLPIPPQRILMLPQFRKVRANRVVWSGLGYSSILDTALLSKTDFFLGVYSDMEN